MVMTAVAPELDVIIFDQLQDYATTFAAMQHYTAQRHAHTPDQIWLLQHHDVLTQGQAGKPEHIIMPSDIPIIKSDRGGQVTWHGPGQLVGYFLLDLNRLNWHVRTLVDFAENMMLWLLQHYGVVGYSRKDAPGIYVHERKIGSLGFKIRRGYSYHGISLNLDCDLFGFSTINPCGFANLEMTRLCDVITPTPSFMQICDLITDYLSAQQLFYRINRQHR